MVRCTSAVTINASSQPNLALKGGKRVKSLRRTTITARLPKTPVMAIRVSDLSRCGALQNVASVALVAPGSKD